MSVISITSPLHSDGHTVALRLAERLGARCVDREALIEAAHDYDITETKVTRLFEQLPTFLERLTEHKDTYLACVRAVMVDWALEGNIIYHGFAGQELWREVPHALKVRLVYPMEQRMQQQMRKYGLSQEHARDVLIRSDQETAKRMHYLFHADWLNARCYDLVLNCGPLTMEESETLILHMATLPAFQPDAERRRRLEDLAIRSRIEALLAVTFRTRAEPLQLSVADGTVVMRGVAPPSLDVDLLMQHIRDLHGVSAIRNELRMAEAMPGRWAI